MSQASMQFAPQWLKKSSVTPTPPPGGPHSSSPPTSSSPSIVNPPVVNTGISYSHMANPTSARSESFASDGISNGGASFGSGGPNGIPMDDVRPFRYSKEAMLALYDSAAVKNRPLELMELVEGGGVVLSEKPNVPFGLTEWNEEDKKTFTTSLNPPTRARVQHPPVTSTPDRETPAPFLRRGTTNTSISSTGAAGGRTIISGGFGRGEGGAFGGGKIGHDNPVIDPPKIERDHRDSGYAPRDRGERPERTERGERYGGTFGGSTGFVNGAFGATGTEVEVGRRPGRVMRGAVGRGAVDGDAPAVSTPVRSSNTAGNWRPSIRNPSVSGSFEGVLGFGGAPEASKPVLESPVPTPSVPAVGGWREREKAAAGITQTTGTPERTSSSLAVGVMPLAGGGTGWTKGGGRWRMAAQAEQADKRPGPNPLLASSTEDAKSSPSVAAIATDTPLEERMNQLSTSNELQDLPSQDQAMPPPPIVAPGDVQWYYTDPAGQQQGPFAASQMQDWFSHNYFVDNLPLRREHESEYHTLAQVKEQTGDAMRPFLAAPSAPPSPPRRVSSQPSSIDSPSHIQVTDGMHSSTFTTHVQPLGFDPMMQVHAQRSVWENNMRSSPFAPHENVAPMVSPFGRPQEEIQGAMFGGGIDPNIAMRMAQQVPFNGISPWGMLPQPIPFGQPIPPQFHAAAPMPAYQNLLLPQSTDAYQPTAPISAWPMPQVPQHHMSPMPLQQEHMASPTPRTVESESMSSITTAPIEEPVSESSEPAKMEEQLVAVEAEAEVTVAIPSPSPQPQTPVKLERKAQKISSALPPPPSSLPAKPVTVLLPTQKEAAVAPPSLEEAVKPSPSAETKGKKVSVVVTEATPTSLAFTKPAPWAKDDERPKPVSGPSLRDIQEAEAKVAEVKKAADAKARAAAQATVVSQSEADLIQNMSWGLPSKPIGAPSNITSSAPVWGQGDVVVKKTLKQIQEEEERRQKVLVAAKLAASNGVTTRRGYADLAAVPSAPVAPQPGWSTVGAGGKTTVASPTPVRMPVVSAGKVIASPLSRTPVQSTITIVKPSAASLDEVSPSIEFIRWTKEALKGLTGVNLDEFIQMLLTFPVEPGTASRADQLEIISDSVYANSSTLDGRRFAQEFYTKRKADAQNRLAAPNAMKSAAAKSTSLAEIVKTQPKQSNTDFGGFKVVKPKGKGRK